MSNKSRIFANPKRVCQYIIGSINYIKNKGEYRSVDQIGTYIDGHLYRAHSLIYLPIEQKLIVRFELYSCQTGCGAELIKMVAAYFEGDTVFDAVLQKPVIPELQKGWLSASIIKYW